MNRTMSVAVLVAVTILNATVRADWTQKVGALGEPIAARRATDQAAQEADWQRLVASGEQRVAVNKRYERQTKGQMLRVDPDSVLVLSGDRAVRVDRKDVCDVMTYESSGGRRARYAGGFGAVGAGIGVASWLAKSLGDQRNLNLASEVAISGGAAALIGLAIERAHRASPPERLYRADNRPGCP